jgi:hypothetical protein
VASRSVSRPRNPSESIVFGLPPGLPAANLATEACHLAITAIWSRAHGLEWNPTAHGLGSPGNDAVIVTERIEGHCLRYRRTVIRSKTTKEIPATSRESDAFSRDLERRGFSFVGSTIVYADMQAVGMVNDRLA